MVIKGYWGERTPEEELIVDSSGHIFTFRGREIDRPNGRPNYLLLYIYHGDAKFFFGKREVICSSGDFILYAPNEPQHHIYESNAAGEFYYVHFTTDTELANLLDMKTSTPYHSVPSAKLCDIFEEIISELQHKNHDYKIICQSLLAELFVKVHRQIENSANFRVTPELNSVIQYINKNYAENLSLEEYAKMCGLSKYHFLREFKKFTHTSPLKYRSELRICHAKDMLKLKGNRINKIAEELGYSSTEYFSEAFLKSVGVRPSEYTKMCQNALEEAVK